jgi:hypothetical protein
VHYLDNETLRDMATYAAQSAIVKVAGFKEVGAEIAKRGVNPATWLKRGWDTYGEMAHPTAKATRGWMGSSNWSKYIPIGPKSLTVGLGAATAPAAFAEEDPSGEGKSRGRRIGGWLGSTLGSVAGSMPMKAGLAGVVPILGATAAGQYGGEIIGGKLG